MDLSFLPFNVLISLEKCRLDSALEIRFRLGFPIKLIFSNGQSYLTQNGESINKTNAIICTQNIIDEIIRNATKSSLYAYSEELKRCFLTTEQGIRLGVTGECVAENGQVVALKKITSINLRFTREIKGCSNSFYNKLFNEGEILNTLIISPPLKGKTTMLKDLARKLDELNKFSILIVDERGEFSNLLGGNIDTISYSTKLIAFEYGIRAMSPQVIITDELWGFTDWDCVYRSVRSGVKVIASCHALNLEDVKEKQPNLSKIFDRYVVLNSENIGEIVGVYNSNFKLI